VNLVQKCTKICVKIPFLNLGGERANSGKFYNNDGPLPESPAYVTSLLNQGHSLSWNPGRKAQVLCLPNAIINRPGCFTFTFLFTKICASKNPLLQLRVLSTFWQLQQWQFLNYHWKPNESIDSSNFLFLFNFLLLHLQLFLRLPSFSTVRYFLRVAAQNEVDSWIRGAASCSEGGESISRSATKLSRPRCRNFV